MLFNLLAAANDIGANVLKSLEIMWKGMLAIFLVIGILIAITSLMSYATKRIEEKKAAKTQTEESDDSTEV